MLHRVFNLINIYRTISIASLIGTIGALESGMYVTLVVMAVVFVASAYLAAKEDGKIK